MKDIKDLVQIGKIIGTHGHRGEVKVYLLTDFPERFRSLKEVFLVTPSGQRSLSIERVRFHKGYVIMKSEECHTMNDAEKLKGGMLCVPEDELYPLGEDEYYCFQLIGMDVYTEEGLHLGVVEDIFPTGSNDVYVVRDDHKEYLIPAIKEVVREINLETRRITIHLLKGLLNLSDAL